jgi:ATP adenylyltransferase
LQYVDGTSEVPKGDFLSRVDGESDDRANLVIDRSADSIIVLNRFPYSNGHLLVAPRRAVAELEELADHEQVDLQRQITRMIRALRVVVNPHGFNVGINLGRSAGAGLPEHLHWHVVPRWNGDTNFMTLMSDVRVIVQSLDEVWLRLRKELGLPT